ncbi:DEAD/DEAH box helicase [Lactobacillus psittaci]|uniref:Competence protein n=1 Tax=Lactobacillus psittaci DSM 15354 TaxID=1122152 RepID=A0A0R1S5H9_9LACO|nr:DEAD/DEAH box helicase family protein [Lactobacillus psittaci]KRL63881.1 competence protein [Lactobacillus psittaci DSM 15354]
MEDLTPLSGRQWISNQANSSIFEDCIKVETIKDDHCQRCGQKVTDKLADKRFYCRRCIGLGRCIEGEYLFRLKGQGNYTVKEPVLTWKGKLTSDQARVSQEILEAFDQRRNHLVHAVTGAGKTEMLFKVLEKCLSQGLRAAIATPRIDVVNELYPRINSAFANTVIGKYHGREYNDVKNDQLVICTTHQLLKFYRTFDLLIIDEVDSFPYAPDPMLHYGAKNAVKELGQGMILYLTATPPDDLLKAVKQKKIGLSLLKRRFHGGKLPVPKEKLFIGPYISKQRINHRLKTEILRVVQSGHPLLLFVPKISEIPIYLALLKKIPELTTCSIEGVHAADKDRIDKVANFRAKKTQILVTTTILERGVTFPHVWVIIVAADDPIYTRASLVQIAGRVGRSKEDPTGLVLYCYHRYTKNIKEAIKEIKRMNR